MRMAVVRITYYAILTIGDGVEMDTPLSSLISSLEDDDLRVRTEAAHCVPALFRTFTEHDPIYRVSVEELSWSQLCRDLLHFFGL